MKIIHISGECYPAAKAGGLGDVVGALPKYLNELDATTGVVIPKYKTKWINAQEFREEYRGTIRLDSFVVDFTIEKEVNDSLGFPFFVVDIPGFFDRPGIYGDPSGGWYEDDVERWLSFQEAVLQWIDQFWYKPEVIHCHDHHTGLVPFMTKYCPEFRSLSRIPTVFTIHNGEYHGAFGWDKLHLLPYHYPEATSALDWDGRINPLAVAIKCAWKVTTVSPSYLQELMQYANGLEGLLRQEQKKAVGIINGIDLQVWDPQTDTFIARQFKKSVNAYKTSNKLVLGQRFNVDLKLPVVTFIGRLVGEKGADLLPDLYRRIIYSGMQVAFIVLGSGDPYIQDAFWQMKYHFAGRFDAAIEYNEALAHQLYAGSDFLIMPSRVEPCGLNQMYSMRYGTVPIVRSVGGLKDTVSDIKEPDGSGRGVQFTHFSLEEAQLAIQRAVDFFYDKKSFEKTRQHIMGLDFSWEKSASNYLEIYNQLTQ